VTKPELARVRQNKKARLGPKRVRTDQEVCQRNTKTTAITNDLIDVGLNNCVVISHGKRQLLLKQLRRLTFSLKLLVLAE